MKKIFVFILLLICIRGISQITFPVPQNIASPTTLLNVRGGLQMNNIFIPKGYADTTAANNDPYAKYYPGIIRTTSDGKLWKRNEALTAWVEVGAGGNFINNQTTLQSSANANIDGYFRSAAGFGSGVVPTRDFDATQSRGSNGVVGGTWRNTSSSGYVGVTFQDNAGGNAFSIGWGNSGVSVSPSMTHLNAQNTALQIQYNSDNKIGLYHPGGYVGINGDNVQEASFKINARPSLSIPNLLVKQNASSGDAIQVNSSSGSSGNMFKVTSSSEVNINSSSDAGDYNLQVTGGNYLDITGKTWKVIGLAYNSDANLVAVQQDTVTGLFYRKTSGGGGGSPGGSNKQVQYNNSGAFGGASGFEVGNTNNRVKIEAQATTEVPLEIRLAASQTADAFQIKNSAGNTIIQIQKDSKSLFTSDATATLQNPDGFDNVLQMYGGGNARFLVSSGSSYAERVILMTHGSGVFSGVAGGYIGTETNNALNFLTNKTTKMVLDAGGDLGIGVTNPTGYLHFKAGTTGANTALIKAEEGSIMSTAEAGTIEYNGEWYMTKKNAVRYGVGGTLNTQYATVGNVGTGEDDLMSFSVPAGTLSADGDYLEVEMVFDCAANANSKTIKVYYGSVSTYTIPPFTTSGTDVRVKVTVLRTGAATQRISITYTSDNGSTQVSGTLYTTDTETLSGAVTIKATGEATSNDDITQTMLLIRYFPANPDPT